MTGGIVAILGAIGVNFGAGMTGGFAYLYDQYGDLERRINFELLKASASQIKLFCQNTCADLSTNITKRLEVHILLHYSQILLKNQTLQINQT